MTISRWFMINFIIYICILLFSAFSNAEDVKNTTDDAANKTLVTPYSEKDFYKIYEFDRKNAKIVSLEKSFKVMNVLKNLGLDEKARLVFYSKNECGSTPYQVAFKEIKEKDYSKIYTLNLDCKDICSGKIIYYNKPDAINNDSVELDFNLCRETIGGLFKNRLEKYKNNTSKEEDKRIYLPQYKFIDDGL